MFYDTIAAISTPLGEGAISIVRLSGQQAIPLLKKVFPKIQEREIETHRVYYGHIVNPANGQKIDEVLVTILREPKTYTREDIVEINCHGGMAVTKQVLDLLISQGARNAAPGEFTKRAFVNGRIDLTQAEAVIDLIRAKTEQSAAHSLYQLQGGLKRQIAELSEKVKQLLIQLELRCDFSDEDIETSGYEQILTELTRVIKVAKKLIANADEGKIYRQGVNVVIAGRPNVGKSSLLNALLKEKRAIVTPVAGTTRDIIEEYINIEGVPFKISDTAGITSSENPIEKEGIRRSKKAVAGADLLLIVRDITAQEGQPYKIRNVPAHKIIEVYNKIDKLKKPQAAEKKRIFVSAKTGDGLEELKKEMVNRVLKKEFRQAEHPFISNSRQKEALEKALNSLVLAQKAMQDELMPDLISVDIRAALDKLGEISGNVTREDVLNSIFAEFCIGK